MSSELHLFPTRITDALVHFFDQFEPAEGWRSIMSQQDQIEMGREMTIGLVPGSSAWWDDVIRRSKIDGHAAAIEFRNRMRKENRRYL